MKKYTPLLGTFVAFAFIGCESNPEPVTRSEMNTAMMDYHTMVTIEEAILQQQTLYGYHFMTGTDRLNAIGQRDVSVLARHYASNPGTVNILRGEADDILYEDRVAAVMEAFEYAGVDASLMNSAEGLPGGTGSPSSWSLMVRDRIDGNLMSDPN